MAGCSNRTHSAQGKGGAGLSGKGGWTETGRREEEEEDSGAGAAELKTGDWVDGAGFAAGDVGRVDVLKERRTGDRVRSRRGTADEDADDLGTDEVVGGSMSGDGDWVTVEPGGMLARVEVTDDLEMLVLCDSSSETAKGAGVLANDDGTLARAGAKVAVDLKSVFEVNSGFVLNEGCSCWIWTSLFQICF